MLPHLKSNQSQTWALWCDVPVSLPSSYWFSPYFRSLIGGDNGRNENTALWLVEHKMTTQNTALSLVETKWLPADTVRHVAVWQLLVGSSPPSSPADFVVNFFDFDFKSWLLNNLLSRSVFSSQSISEKDIEFVQDGVRHQADGHLQEGAERLDATDSDGGRHLHLLRPLHHLHARHRAALLCQPRCQVRAAGGK